MKNLFVVLLFTLFIGCEKETPLVIEEEPELCWECVTSDNVMTKSCTRNYYDAAMSGIKKREIVCGLTQEAITLLEESGTYSTYTYGGLSVSGNCSMYIQHYHKIKKVCTLLPN